MLEHNQTKLVAVYGSLKSGFHNSDLLRECPTFSRGFTPKEFTMFSLGSYPAIINSGRSSIEVEVYEVSEDTFANLDRLEGYPTFYTRKEIPIYLYDGNAVIAWIYILANPDRLIDGRPKYSNINSKGHVEWQY